MTIDQLKDEYAALDANLKEAGAAAKYFEENFGIPLERSLSRFADDFEKWQLIKEEIARMEAA